MTKIKTYIHIVSLQMSIEVINSVIHFIYIYISCDFVLMFHSNYMSTTEKSLLFSFWNNSVVAQRRGFLCNYCMQFLQGTKIIARLMHATHCNNCTIIACNYCSVLHAIIAHKSTVTQKTNCRMKISDYRMSRLMLNDLSNNAIFN